MTINTKKFFNENELPDLPGLGGVSSAISNYNQMIQPNLTEQKNMKNVSTNINQSVEQFRTTTVIQPVINNVEVPTPVPQPTPVPIRGKTNTVFLDSSNNNTLAKLIR
tara:strand:+ start:417 stop:740 length:324 start_codon:yes stop_codon:yes gene_type:complete